MAGDLTKISLDKPRDEVSETSHHDEKELRRIARKCLGAAVNKPIGDKILPGKVVEYDLDNGWFKIKYEDEDDEEMSKDDVIKLLAKPDKLRASFNLLPTSSEEYKPKRTKTAIRKKKKRCSALMARAINSYIPERAEAPKRPRQAKAPSMYVPLALSEKKKDEYYWP